MFLRNIFFEDVILGVDLSENYIVPGNQELHVNDE